MAAISSAFSLPAQLSADFARVRAYWESLKRGGNELPFSDDLNPSPLGELRDRLILLEAFDHPPRFRVNSAGKEILSQYATDLAGKFVEELDPKPPIQFLAAQASATVEARRPTYLNCAGPAAAGRTISYERVMFPLWGDGRIVMIMAVIGPLHGT